MYLLINFSLGGTVPLELLQKTLATMIVILTIVTISTVLWILLLVSAYQKATNAICVSKTRLDGKTALITGGETGMGFEIAKDFALRGARVIIACPFEEEGLNARKKIIQETDNEDIVFKLLDLGSLKSTRQFAEDILKTEDRLDILVNNAGLAGPLMMSNDGLNYIMQVNYFGPYLLTILLLPLLRKTGKPEEPSRIVNTSSLTHRVGEVKIEHLNSYSKIKYLQFSRAYGNSKLCITLFSHELSKKIQNWNVVVNSVDPGAVGTRIYRSWNLVLGPVASLGCSLLFKTAWQGAQTAIYVAVDKEAGKMSGAFFKNCRVASPAKRATNDKVSKMLWQESARLVKLNDEEIQTCFNS